MDQYTLSQKQVESEGILERVDFYRRDATRLLDTKKRSDMGQFLTPTPVARFMASLFKDKVTTNICLLDAGAGIGSLTAAFVEEFCRREHKPDCIRFTAYELDPLLFEYLNTTLTECQRTCDRSSVNFCGEMLKGDFIRAGIDLISKDLFPTVKERHTFTHAILNPPYKKIRSDSESRLLLRSIGVETSNLYTGFLAVAIKLLEQGGELVAIIPRSFCNGPYFKPFRKLLLDNMGLHHIHVFESRNETFKDDEVLQENVIFHVVKDEYAERVVISTSTGPSFENVTFREVELSQIVKPGDPERLIHITTNQLDQYVLDRVSCFEHTLEDIGINVSTGRVVDFRCKDHLKDKPEEGSIPLIYPTHFDKGFIRWPKLVSKKPNAIVLTPSTEHLILPAGYYVVVRRFSPKEEYHRIVPAIYEPAHITSPYVTFENHLNVYHCNNAGLPPRLAKGLAVFLHSSLLDIYFRHFNGHTQVNVSDLKTLRYPSRQVLEAIGDRVGEAIPSQKEIDELIEKEVHKMANITSPDPVNAKEKIDEALKILKLLGLPKAQ